MLRDLNIKFIDLFAGMGGFRLGFEKACQALEIKSQCVFTSEIKDHAIKVYKDNFGHENIFGDITQITSENIPDFDVMLAGFPCQAFSSAGKRQGFLDTRGTLFFEIERILEAKKPSVFILENVEGLIYHDKNIKSDEIGKTFKIILEKLNILNYKVSWKIFDSKDFGLAQTRKRIFIIGTKNHQINLDDFSVCHQNLGDILESGKPTIESKLTDLLLSHFSIDDLHGKSVKDKRGGKDNIHSWDIGLKGEINSEQKKILNLILLHRRSKKWAEAKGIKWMDGMPLTIHEIREFYNHPQLQEFLDDLTHKKYLKFEYPKDSFQIEINGIIKKIRKYREDLPKGYNIVAGKLSYEIAKILDPKKITPTLVATDLDRVVVPDKKGLRKLSVLEKLRLFGFPDTFKIDISERLTDDIFGNTVAVSVVCAIAERVISQVFLNKEIKKSIKKPKAQQLSLLDE